MPKLTETIMKSTQTSRIVVSVSIVISFGLMIYSWIVSPQVSYIQAAQRYETLSDSMEKKVADINNSIRIKKNKIADLQQELGSIGVSFFKPDEAAEFFGEFEKFAIENNCRIQSLNFARDKIISLDTENKENLKVVEKAASLNFAGRYNSIIGLLKTLSAYPKKIYMTDMFIESTGTGSSGLICDIKIKVYLTQDKELLADE